MTKIFLIRHGETEWNKIGKLQGSSDIKLLPEGIQQAHLLAEHAPFHNVDAIYSSDLERAVKTAEILAAKFHLPVIKERGLRETSFGEWEGRFLSDLAKENPKGFEKFFTRPDKVQPPNGETFLQSQARIMNALGEIIADNDGKSVIVVSHGADVGNRAIQYGVERADFLRRKFFGRIDEQHHAPIQFLKKKRHEVLNSMSLLICSKLIC